MKYEPNVQHVNICQGILQNVWMSAKGYRQVVNKPPDRLWV
ncbi:unnamed protein product [Larinioides sclopetarius]|uniref:Ribosomal protein L33 n=1 Tax=Larinioides sclopetarius TaxID=280406 RepID=A0AAV1ZQA9_9ARAC